MPRGSDYFSVPNFIIDWQPIPEYGGESPEAEVQLDIQTWNIVGGLIRPLEVVAKQLRIEKDVYHMIEEGIHPVSIGADVLYHMFPEMNRGLAGFEDLRYTTYDTRPNLRKVVLSFCRVTPTACALNLATGEFYHHPKMFIHLLTGVYSSLRKSPVDKKQMSMIGFREEIP